MAKFNEMTPRQQEWVEARKKARAESKDLKESQGYSSIKALVAGYVTSGGNRLSCKIKV
jgi:hypothetical protein